MKRFKLQNILTFNSNSYFPVCFSSFYTFILEIKFKVNLKKTGIALFFLKYRLSGNLSPRQNLKETNASGSTKFGCIQTNNGSVPINASSIIISICKESLLMFNVLMFFVGFSPHSN